MNNLNMKLVSSIQSIQRQLWLANLFGASTAQEVLTQMHVDRPKACSSFEQMAIP